MSTVPGHISLALNSYTQITGSQHDEPELLPMGTVNSLSTEKEECAPLRANSWLATWLRKGLSQGNQGLLSLLEKGAEF